MVTPVVVIVFVFVAGVVVAGIIVAGIASTPTSSNRKSCCSMTADRCGEPIPAANDYCSRLGQAAECLEALAEKSSCNSLCCLRVAYVARCTGQQLRPQQQAARGQFLAQCMPVSLNWCGRDDK